MYFYSSDVNDDQVKPRSLRFTWSMKTTSLRDPNEIMMEIRKVFTFFSDKKKIMPTVVSVAFYLILLLFIKFLCSLKVVEFFFSFISIFLTLFFGSCSLIRNDGPYCPLLTIRPLMHHHSPLFLTNSLLSHIFSFITFI